MLSSSPSVLFVDDDSAFLASVRRAMHREPVHVLTAESAGAALALLEQASVDVIVSDEEMPGLRGSELLGIVNQRYPHIVRILLSGRCDFAGAVRAVNSGQVRKLLSKPCERDELALAVREALGYAERSSDSLETLKMQSSYIESLERQHPGISKIKRTPSGAILVDERQEELDQIKAQFGVVHPDNEEGV